MFAFVPGSEHLRAHRRVGDSSQHAPPRRAPALSELRTDRRIDDEIGIAPPVAAVLHRGKKRSGGPHLLQGLVSHRVVIDVHDRGAVLCRECAEVTRRGHHRQLRLLDQLPRKR